MTEITPALGLPAYLLGRRIAGQRKRTPVAYLYNGVRLPALPEWDKRTYPYAAISSATMGGATVYYLVVSTVKLNFKRVFSYWYFYPQEDGRLQNYAPKQSENTWELMELGSNTVITSEFTAGSTGIAAVSDTVVWANYDLSYSNGSAYISASEPVPVYE